MQIFQPPQPQPEWLKDLQVAIRPEKIHLQKTPIIGEKRDNVFDATISEEIFKGATDDLTISTANGLELTVCAANESAHEECFSKGTRCTAGCTRVTSWCCRRTERVATVFFDVGR